MAYRKIKAVAFEGFHRYSVAHFLVAVVALFMATPFVQHLPAGDLIEKMLGSIVILSGVAAVGGRRRTLFIGIGLTIPALGMRWVDQFRPGVFPQELILISVLACVVFVTVNLFWFVLRAPKVNAEVLCAGIATFLMLGICWSIIFTIEARLDPESFVFGVGPPQHHVMSGFEALYFSVGTLSGICYGDITPVSRVARMLSLLEGMTGLFYLAVLISRLVSLYSSDRTSKSGNPETH